MSTEAQKPIIFLAFANEPAGGRGHLRNLGEEARRQGHLDEAEAGLTKALDLLETHPSPGLASYA